MTRVRKRGGGLLAASSVFLASCVSAPAVEDQPVDSELGSTRGSVVAIAREVAPGRQLVYLTSHSNPDELGALPALVPGVRLVTGLTRESALEHAPQAHGIDAHLVTPQLLERAPKLRWIQAWSAGVERYLGVPGIAEGDLVLTNMKGVHGPVIAEHCFAMLLSLTRGLRHFDAAQREARWDRRAASEMSALSGQTMLVVGLGGIGHEVARRAHAFGMRVLATNPGVQAAPDYVDHLGTPEELNELLIEADVLAICVPLTPDTEGMFDAARIDLMKDGAYLINIARGRIVETDALLAALEAGRLGGACLDVTDPEPLPSDHPLWSRDDVVITPHIAGRAALTQERRWELFRENVRRFGSFEPLLNVVDKAAGY